MKVPQLEPWVGQDEYKAISSCFENNWITEGPKTKEFEEKLLKLIGAKYGVFATNGTLALYLGLKALGIEAGDEVIVPDFTFIASATAVQMAGATPIFIDVNRENFQIDVTRAERLITKHTKAIMPVHMYGTVADMKSVLKFARRYNLKVIEDAAQAIGVFRYGKHAGTFGDVGTFSFFADKTITTAEGGFVVTNSKDIYENLLYLRNQGRIDRGSFVHPRIGYNFRITDIHAAIGLVQLNKLDKIVERKKRILALYESQLEGISEISFFTPDDGADWIPFRVPILANDAHELMDYLSQNEISPRTFFYPLHNQPAFSYLKSDSKKGKSGLYDDTNYPNSIYGYEHGVCLPVFPGLKDEQIDYVCRVIKEFYGKRSSLFYESYDDLFDEKDYSEETQNLFNLSEKYGISNPKKILEIGCGTGNHTKEILRSTKAKVIAIDIDNKMIELAQKKINHLKFGKRVKFLCTNLEELEEDKFDLACAMFNVISYIADESALENFMKAISSRLKTGAIFVFDCWNGVAAIQDPPKSKRVTVEKKDKTIESYLTSETNLFYQRTLLTYKIKVSKGKEKQQGSFSFYQTLWTPMQVLTALKKANLEVVFTSPISDTSIKASDKDWKILFCARKI